MQRTVAAEAAIPTATAAVLPVLILLSLCHMLNDLMQSLIPALYPMLKQHLHLEFTQIGLITLSFQLTVSLLQPTVGVYTDRRPQPYSLAIGMGATLFGFAFGLGGLGAAVMGRIADATSVHFVFQLCSYLPAIGLITWLLPNLDCARTQRPV